MVEIQTKRTAVVAVHLQGDVVTREGAFGGFFVDMVERTGVLPRSRKLIDTARAAGATIAFTRIAFPADHAGLLVNNQLFKVVDQARCCVEGTPGATVVDDVAPGDGDLDIAHRRVSGTYASTLVDELRTREIDTILIFGVATNLSVEATARGLSDEGFRVIVVADCCTAADQAAHDASLGSLGLLVAEVSDAETVMAALDASVPA